MPENEVRIPFRDWSWVYGDGCFDMTRSFGHRLFKVKEHVDRLYRSLKYLRIDPGFGPQKMCDLTEELFERNRHLLGRDDDYWVGQRISRGVKEVEGDNLDHHGPNIVLECMPLPLRAARQAVQGGHPRRDPVAPPRAAGIAHAARQDAQLPEHGRRQSGSAEHRSGSLGGAARYQRQSLRGHGLEYLHRARRRNVHAAREIRAAGREPADRDRSRQAEGMPLHEADLDLYDAYNADEVFLTSTSLCICPVTQVNGVEIGPKGQVWGPVTRLTDAYQRFVDFDFVDQYLKRYVEGMEARAF